MVAIDSMRQIVVCCCTLACIVTAPVFARDVEAVAVREGASADSALKTGCQIFITEATWSEVVAELGAQDAESAQRFADAYREYDTSLATTLTELSSKFSQWQRELQLSVMPELDDRVDLNGLSNLRRHEVLEARALLAKGEDPFLSRDTGYTRQVLLEGGKLTVVANTAERDARNRLVGTLEDLLPIEARQRLAILGFLRSPVAVLGSYERWNRDPKRSAAAGARERRSAANQEAVKALRTMMASQAERDWFDDRVEQLCPLMPRRNPGKPWSSDEDFHEKR